jgi:hypothetical protein
LYYFELFKNFVYYAIGPLCVIMKDNPKKTTQSSILFKGYLYNILSMKMKQTGENPGMELHSYVLQ